MFIPRRIVTQFLILVGATANILFITGAGCNDNPPGNGPIRQETITAQMVFDEAAKGPLKTDLTLLLAMYNKAVKNRATGATLAAIYDPTGDYFLCKLFKLAAVEQTRDIAVSLLKNHLADPKLAINRTCSGSKFPLELLIDTTRSVSGDKADDFETMITVVLDKSDGAAMAVVDNNNKMIKVLDAVTKKGNQSLLKRVFTDLPVAIKADLITWFITHKADANIRAAAQAANLITAEMVFAEAQKGAAANTTDLKFLYDMAINTHAKAASLAVLPAVGGDAFSNFLAKLDPDAHTLALWTDFFARIQAGAGLHLVDALINRAGAGGDTTFKSLLAKPDSADRNATIKLFVEKSYPATIAAVADAQLPALYEAMRKVGDQALLIRVLRETGASAAQQAALRAWSLAHAADQILLQAGTPTVEAALTGLLVLEVRKGMLANKYELKLLYDLAINTNAKAAALAALPPDLNGHRFSNSLSLVPPDANTRAIWADYLGRLEAAGSIADVRAQLALVDSSGSTVFQTLLSAGDNATIKLFVEKSDAAIIAAVPAAQLPALYERMRQFGDQALLTRVLRETGAGAAEQTARLDWSIFNAPQPILLQPGTPTVKTALTGANIFTEAMVLAEAQAIGLFDTTNKLKFLYDVAIDTPAKAATLATLPPAAGNKFANFLANLIPDANTKSMWADYLAKIEAHSNIIAVRAQINLAGAHDTPFTSLLEKVDSADRNATIKLFVEKSDAAIIAAIAAAQLPRLYEAIREVGTKAMLLSILTNTAATAPEQAARLTWATAHANDPILLEPATPTVKTAVTGTPIFTDAMVVLEAQKYAGDTAKIRFLYDVVIDSGAKAADLAAKYIGNNERFSNALAQFPPNAHALAIWNDYFAKIEAHSNSAAVRAQIGLADAHGETTFKILLKQPDTADRNAIIKLFVEKSDAAIIAAIATAELPKLYEAIRKVGTPALLRRVLEETAPTAQNEAARLKWVMQHRKDDIGGTKTNNEVLDLVRTGAYAWTNDAALLAEITKPAPNWKKVLFYLQVLAFDEPSALMVANLNNAGVLLHNLIVAKAQTPESVSALKYYLSYLTPANWALIRGNNGGGSTAVATLSQPAHPDAGALAAALPHAIKDALLIFEDAMHAAQAAPPVADPITNEAP